MLIVVALLVTLVSACALNVGYLIEHSAVSKLPRLSFGKPAAVASAAAAAALAGRLRDRGCRLAALRSRAHTRAALARPGDCRRRGRDPRGHGLAVHRLPVDPGRAARLDALGGRPCAARGLARRSTRQRLGGVVPGRRHLAGGLAGRGGKRAPVRPAPDRLGTVVRARGGHAVRGRRRDDQDRRQRRASRRVRRRADRLPTRSARWFCRRDSSGRIRWSRPGWRRC